jgi:predicted NAD/FAD-dependent oxidoreductase
LVQKQAPSLSLGDPKGFLKIDDIMICGDHNTSASIEGAIISGNETAAAVLSSMDR